MANNIIFKKKLFSFKNIIVTGGGIGICTAHKLAVLGSYVLLLWGKYHD